MSRTLIAVPIAMSELDAIAGLRTLSDRVAYAATPGLLQALEYREDQLEEGEYAALVLASVASLIRYGQRTVLIAEVDTRAVSPGSEEHNGEVRVQQITASAMTCWFTDEETVDPSEVAKLVTGMGLDDAWDLPAVHEFISTHELLWHDKQEYSLN